MPATHFSALTPGRKILLALCCCAVAYAWTGNLDRYSQGYLDEALANGGLIYATARGINALVSLLQGTEFTPWLFTISVGEVLDPVNDLIERFSAVLLLALGSLALQKILLQIVAATGFNLLLSGLGLLLLACAVWPVPRFYPVALRLFLLALAVRLALGVVVIASGYVDRHFLRAAEERSHAEMTVLRDDLQALSAAAASAPSQREIAALERDLEALAAQRARQERQRGELARTLPLLEQELEALRARLPLEERWNPLTPDTLEIAQKKGQIAQVESRLAALAEAARVTAKEIARQEEALDCLRAQASGESCRFWDRAANLLSPAEFSRQVSELETSVTRFAASAVDLLVSLLLKTVLIPLLFLYALITGYRSALRALLAD